MTGVRFRKAAFMLLLATAILSGHMARAADNGRFFEALYDVPVMPGLTELPDQAFLFDKPDGRIASAVAEGKALQEKDISRFYDETLTQMGWRRAGEGQYARGKDRLSFRYKPMPASTVVTITLEPAAGGPAR